MDEEDERDPEDDLNKLKDDDDEEEKRMKKLKQEAGAQESEDSKSSAKKSTNKNEENTEPKRETNPDELVSTAGASQRAESFFATDLSKLKAEEAAEMAVSVTSRDEVEKDLARFKEMCSQRQLQQQQHEQQPSGLLEHECLKLWLEYESITNQLSKELCEQLRLILEPTVCSKLRGRNFIFKYFL